MNHIFTVPPDRISIKDDTGVERSTVVGPYAEGDIITLSCEVFGGKYFHTTVSTIHIKRECELICSFGDVRLISNQYQSFWCYAIVIISEVEQAQPKFAVVSTVMIMENKCE